MGWRSSPLPLLTRLSGLNVDHPYGVHTPGVHNALGGTFVVGGHLSVVQPHAPAQQGRPEQTEPRRLVDIDAAHVTLLLDHSGGAGGSRAQYRDGVEGEPPAPPAAGQLEATCRQVR